MVSKDYFETSNYNLGFSIRDIFLKNNFDLVLVESDELIMLDGFKPSERTLFELPILDLKEMITKCNFSENQLAKIINAIKEIKENEVTIYPINYSPFDIKYGVFTDLSNNMMGRSINSTVKHFIQGKNIGLVVSRTVFDNYDIQITNTIIEKRIMAASGGTIPSVYPLYIYAHKNDQKKLLINTPRTPNLNRVLVDAIAKGLDLQFVPEKVEGNVCMANNSEVRDEFRTTFAPIDLLDYIYAVLHSPTYRETYKEFLKIDFPRVPYPFRDAINRVCTKEEITNFWQLVALGGELRQIHLLESLAVEKYITQYPNDGNNVVGKIHFENNRVYINYDKASPLGIEGLQYFANVPEVAWKFYIGGYQPAQKWLKDRKDRELSYEDILHYQKIIVALTETDRIMKEIDKIEI